jgi:hypothetical protein
MSGSGLVGRHGFDGAPDLPGAAPVRAQPVEHQGSENGGHRVDSRPAMSGVVEG